MSGQMIPYLRCWLCWGVINPIGSVFNLDVYSLFLVNKELLSPLWLSINVTFKCVQNRKECRKADLGWQEHMWPVFSYKCVLSSWMGMHRVRYKLPGQLKSAFSPVTPPRQPQNGSRCETHKWAPGPRFPSFYHNLILASVWRNRGWRDLWK